ncbi:TolC family protein [candidate division KSB1 bacterium]|nr:TolC family protein [candidate division KSB1 bacterium]
MANRIVFKILLVFLPVLAFSGSRIHITLDRAVDIAMENSYRVKRLKLNIERSTFWLKSRQAGLKSKVYLNLKTPDLQNISDYKWNSILYKDEIVHQNTQMWESVLSIQQPVILFGYPTNGYVSFNYQVYRYLQKENGSSEVDYYNRLYMRYVQPFFLPNELKNDLEEAELNLEDVQLDYMQERVEIIEDISDDYYDAFEMDYTQTIYQRQMDLLLKIQHITENFQKERRKDQIQVQLEMANVRESILENQSRLRMALADMKQRLRLDISDSLFITPEIQLNPVRVDLDEALHYGFTLNPQLQRLQISERKAEIDLENVKGWDAFRMELEVTYGLEKNDQQFRSIWEQYNNSNSITLNAYVPIWDWGKRKYRIEAERRDLQRRELDTEERQEDLRKDIITAQINLKEYLDRCLNMQESLKLGNEFSEISIQEYENGGISLSDLLQIVTRNQETESKLLESYLGYKRSVMELMVSTYYDFEKGESLLDALNGNG